MEVNLDLWGKYNFSGVHDNDVPAVPNIYDKKRKYFFDEHKKFLEKEEVYKHSQHYILDICNG